MLSLTLSLTLSLIYASHTCVLSPSHQSTHPAYFKLFVVPDVAEQTCVLVKSFAIFPETSELLLQPVRERLPVSS